MESAQTTNNQNNDELQVNNQPEAFSNENTTSSDEYVDPAHKDEGPDVEERPDDVPPPDTTPTTESVTIVDPEQPVTQSDNSTQDSTVESAPPATLGTEISDEGVIVHNPAFDESQSETTVEVQSQPKELAETSTDISPEAVVGGAALALGAAAIAAKRLITRKQR